MRSQPLISIITPAYNAEKHIKDSISSVINQSWPHWELLIINDGSSDATENIIFQFSDQRIRYFEQENTGVSAARNLGLKNMRGDFFCFLDADDVLSENSLKSRLEVFSKSLEIQFVDGCVEERNENLRWLINKYMPAFRGNPLRKLIKISSSCFKGQTWMIRRNKKLTYIMPTDQTHGEDLYFFAELARKGGSYDYTEETVLIYRGSEGSAMNNLSGLDESYRKIYRKIKEWPEISKIEKLFFLFKSRKIMFLSYYFDGKDPMKAIFSLLKL